MIAKTVAALRDMRDATQIASDEDQEWLSKVWHGALAKDNQCVEARLKRMQWAIIVVEMAVILVFLGVLTWLGAR